MGSLHFERVLHVLFCSISLAFVISLHGVEGYACHAQEREALLSLRKVALSAGAQYGAWSKWDEQEAECCEWQGVRCDEVTGRVVTLQLAGCSECDDDFRTTCGALPSLLARLESLQVLDLRGGCFSDAMPALTFPNLTYLDLSDNCFFEADQLLAQPVQLLKFTYLNLSHNFIDSFNLSQLVHSFPNLRYLDLSGNGAQGWVIPEHLSSLQSLAYLDLSNNNFSNPVPWQSLGHLSHLRHLGLGSEGSEVLLWEESKADWPCTWESLESLSCINMGFRTSNASAPLMCLEDPTLVSRLKSLSFTSSSSNLGPLHRSLSLPNNSLSLTSLSLEGTSLGAFESTHPPSWSKLLHAPFLQTLILKGCGLTGIPLWLQQLARLQSLDISGNNMSDFSGLHTYPLLKSLDLSHCNLRELPRSLLPRLPCLETLSMAGNSLTGFPSGLKSLVHLRELDMSENDLNGTLEYYQALLEKCTRLTSLRLSHNNINGVIPQSILKPSLVSLHLSYNHIFGAIPHAIGNLSLLSELGLSYNLLSGVIPASIRNLGSLSVLKLSGNRLSGAIPTSLGNLSLLQVLDLSANRLSGAIPTSLGNISSLLRFFDLSANNLSGAIPTSLGNSSLLQHLDLSANRLSGAIPTSLGSSSVLQVLDLSANRLSGVIPTSLGNILSLLWFFDLSANNLSGVLPFSLENWSSLSWFNISFNNFTGILPHDFIPKIAPLGFCVDLSHNNFRGSLPQIRAWNIIDLSYNEFSGSVSSSWSNPWMFFHVIKTLSLSNNRLSGSLLNLSRSCDLVLWGVLDLSSNNFSGTLPWEIGNCSRLEVLNLGRNSLSSRLPASLGQLNSLQVLILDNNKFSGEIPGALQNCKILRLLDLSYNQLRGRIPEWITGENFGSLEVLMLSNNQFEGSIPAVLLQNLTSLRILTLASNSLSGIIPSTVDHLRGMAVYRDKYTVDFALEGIYNIRITVSMKGSVYMVMGFVLDTLTIIDFSNNSLGGDVPPQIGTLQGLHSLDLSHNKLSGPIPSSLGNLSGALESLDLSNNQLIGAIPRQLCSLTSLGAFNVSSNQLQGEIPQLSCTPMSDRDESSFADNEGLCGYPLQNQCPAPPSQEPAAIKAPNSPPNHSSMLAKIQEHIAMGGVAIGYVVGFLMMRVILYFKYRQQQHR